MTSIGSELWPYVVLVVAGFLPNEVWRIVGLAVGRGLDEESEVVIVARVVATAILAGVVAKLILFPSGALAMVPVMVRVAAATGGFLVYWFARRSVFAGVAAAELIILAGAGFFVR